MAGFDGFYGTSCVDLGISRLVTHHISFSKIVIIYQINFELFILNRLESCYFTDFLVSGEVLLQIVVFHVLCGTRTSVSLRLSFFETPFNTRSCPVSSLSFLGQGVILPPFPRHESEAGGFAPRTPQGSLSSVLGPFGPLPPFLFSRSRLLVSPGLILLVPRRKSPGFTRNRSLEPRKGGFGTLVPHKASLCGWASPRLLA